MKKTYIEPKSSIIAADVCDDLMISGSAAGEKIIEDGGEYTGGAGQEGITPGARKSVDAWDEW